MANINETIFKAKYAIREDETFDDMCNRVSFTKEQAELMKQKLIIPAGRHLTARESNTDKTLFNCYVLGHKNVNGKGIDSRESISNLEMRADNISSRGGGIGVNWTSLRPKNSEIGINEGGSSGAMSFMKRFAYGQSVITQGKSRRGALMASLMIYHPDIEEFIDIKQDLSQLNNVNISVMVDDKFMNAVKNDEDIELFYPDYSKDKEKYNQEWDGNLFETKLNCKIYKKISARYLWNKMTENAHKTGEPGILFYDTINKLSNCTNIEKITSTNPCLPDWVHVFEEDKGTIRLSELEIGDYVFSKEGFTKVIDKWSTGIKDVYRYSTENNSIDCTENHRIVQNGKKIEIKDAESIDVYDEDNLILNEKIIKKEYLGKFEVFDLTVSNDSHTLFVNDCDVSNCGEEPLPLNLACVLGSINLSEHLYNDYGVMQIDYNKLKKSVKHMVRYLDSTIDVEKYSDKDVEEKSKLYRQIGVGILGFAGMLIKMGINYNSEKALKVAEDIGSFILNEAYYQSSVLARELGKAPIWESNKINNHYIGICNKDTQEHIAKYGLRNSAVLSIAPTGSIAMLLKENGGIEPYFSFRYERDDVLGKRVIEEDIVKKAPNKECLIVAQEVTPEQHIKMQAIWQKYTDASISKTINLPATTTVEDVENAYMSAWELGCKGTTVYRDGCRTGVLNHIKDDVDKDVADIRNIFNKYGDKVIPIGIKPPKSSYMKKKKVKTNKGKKFYFMTGYLEETFETPFELFITTNCHEKNDVVESLIDKMRNLLIEKGVNKEIVETLKEKAKYSAQNNIDRIARLISMALRHNVKIVDIVNVLEEYTESISNLIYHIKKHLESLISDNTIVESEKCPECGSDVIYVGGCKQCVNTESCGWSKC